MTGHNEVSAGERSRWNRRFLAGEKIGGAKFRHNAQVRYVDHSGNSVEGWIVALEFRDSGPAYTVERSDGEPDAEVVESSLMLLHDPHE